MDKSVELLPSSICPADEALQGGYGVPEDLKQDCLTAAMRTLPPTSIQLPHGFQQAVDAWAPREVMVAVSGIAAWLPGR